MDKKEVFVSLNFCQVVFSFRYFLEFLVEEFGPVILRRLQILLLISLKVRINNSQQKIKDQKEAKH